jgi:Peptidase family S41/Tricorn protease C1 domain
MAGNEFFRRNVLKVICLVSIFFCSCEKALQLKLPETSHKAVIEELWQVMDERYALFSVKGIDWQESYQHFLPQVTDEMTEDAFFSVLSNMLDSLKDGHITLTSPSERFTYDGFYTLYPANFNYNNILNNYLHNDYKTSGPLVYKITEGVGYIYYSSFANDLSDEQIDIVINEMKDTKGLMIDVRNNTGGNTVNADKIFSRFINSATLVKYEKIKKGPGHDDFYDAQPHYVSPAGNTYGKPVAVLTNRKCFSACNDFVLYMSQLPNVKLFGDQTGGGGGIPHQYILANGWNIQYSATLTLAPDKKFIENGIPPDESITITPIQESNGVDIIIESAFQHLR